MKLKLVRNPVVGFPVETTEFDEHGEVQTIGLVVQYKRTDKKIVGELSNGAQNLYREENGLDLLKDKKGKVYKWPYKTDADFLDDYVVGWSGVVDEDGSPIEYSLEKRKEFLALYSELEIPIVSGFFQAHTGARAKN